MRTIGIIGGMGPWATADLYLRIVEYYQKRFDAKYDKDFPPFMICSVPIPDVVERLEDKEKTTKILIRAATNLENYGCSFILIVCNSVLFLLEKVRNAVKIPVYGMVEINSDYIKNKGIKRIGILSTILTLNNKIYEHELKKMNISLIRPNEIEQQKITNIIMRQLAGKEKNTDKKDLIRIVQRLKKAGSEAVLIACTDLPNIISQKDVDIPLINCNEIYANFAAEKSHY